MAFSNLETERLILRPLRPADGAAVFRYRSDPEVSRYQNWEPSTLSEVDDFIARTMVLEPDTPGTWYQLAICRRGTGELVGDCGLRFPLDRGYEAEFGISLAPEFQGRGYASEALEAVLAYLFERLDKHRVFGSVDPRNHASLRLMERVGLRREAHFRESLWFKGGWADDVICAILRREWEERDAGRRQSRTESETDEAGRGE
jgi:RimJ/RimL family protein N-acetyltransferase